VNALFWIGLAAALAVMPLLNISACLMIWLAGRLAWEESDSPRPGGAS
jgi:hypothetical protein